MINSALPRIDASPIDLTQPMPSCPAERRSHDPPVLHWLLALVWFAATTGGLLCLGPSQIGPICRVSAEVGLR